MQKVAKIRELNDAFRKTFRDGRVMLTPGVDSLPPADRSAVLTKIRVFSDFNPDNDPNGEHDFVSLDHAGVRYFGKIDYYAPGMDGGSLDPADPKQTVRVLTIMRADEY